MAIDWSSIFGEIHERTSPATSEALIAILAPFTEAEIASQRIDPRKWSLPAEPLPEDLVAFLCWSDGATWRTGSREFSCFGCKEIREYMLAYEFPEYLPGAIPLGLDGGGIFCALDLRAGSNSSLYAAGSGNLDWNDVCYLAPTFTDFCRGTSRIGEEYFRYLGQNPRRA